MAVPPQLERAEHAELAELKLARLSDAYRIALMSRDLVEKGLPWSWLARRVASHIRGRESNVLTARVKGRLVGFAIMQFYDERAHLNLLAVDPAARRFGVGRRLVEWQEEVALSGGMHIVNLEVRANNAGAGASYRMLGYRESKRIPGYYSGREVAIRMTHDLRRG